MRIPTTMDALAMAAACAVTSGGVLQWARHGTTRAEVAASTVAKRK